MIRRQWTYTNKASGSVKVLTARTSGGVHRYGYCVVGSGSTRWIARRGVVGCALSCHNQINYKIPFF